MGLYHKIVGNAGKPEGVLGQIMVVGMNSCHENLADWGCRFLGEEMPDKVLDIGCGGANVKRFLKRNAEAHVTGLDYFAVSVKSARKRNRAAIQQSFEHVLRVLKPGGRFLIVNESTGTDSAAVKFAKIIDGMNLYTPERLRELLEAAGFTDVKIHQATDKP